MASMSAVRIVFVSGGIRNLNKTNPKQRPNLRRELGVRVPLHGEDLMAINLPAIPVATLPGLGLSSSRTLPYRYRHPSTSQETFLQEDIPELRASHGNPIRQVRIYIFRRKARVLIVADCRCQTGSFIHLFGMNHPYFRDF